MSARRPQSSNIAGAGPCEVHGQRLGAGRAAGCRQAAPVRAWALGMARSAFRA